MSGLIGTLHCRDEKGAWASLLEVPRLRKVGIGGERAMGEESGWDQCLGRNVERGRAGGTGGWSQVTLLPIFCAKRESSPAAFGSPLNPPGTSSKPVLGLASKLLVTVLYLSWPL